MMFSSASFVSPMKSSSVVPIRMALPTMASLKRYAMSVASRFTGTPQQLALLVDDERQPHALLMAPFARQRRGHRFNMAFYDLLQRLQV